MRTSLRGVSAHDTSEFEGARRDLEVRLDRQRGYDPKAGDVVYREWLGEFLAAKQRSVKAKTAAGYESLARSRLLPAFGSLAVNRISPGHVDQWIEAMAGEGLSSARIRQAHQLLSASFKAAIRRGLVSVNPAAGAQLPRPTNREMRYLTPPELLAVAGAVPNKHRGLILTLGIAGLRFGEAAALRRQDVDLLHRTLTIERSVTEVNGTLVEGTPKSGRVRTVAIPNRLVRELEDHLGTFPEPRPEAPVFTSDLGVTLRVTNFNRRVFRPAVAAAGVGSPQTVRIHDLRHTAAPR